ncbi:MAG: Arc family DNA-binding protein [Mesorhizobium sp.]
MSDERKPMANIAPFGLRMQPDLKSRVEEAAKANNRSLNAEIVDRLEYTFSEGADRNAWQSYLDFLRIEQDHIENMYLTGKTTELFPETLVSKPKILPALLQEVSNLVTRRTQLAMEVIVKELERNGMLSPGSLPTNDEWVELRSAPREVQPEILDALAKLDIQKALTIARSAAEQPVPFSWDFMHEHWIVPAMQTTDAAEMQRLVQEADTYIKRHLKGGFVRVSEKDGQVGVEFGFLGPDGEIDSKQTAPETDEMQHSASQRPTAKEWKILRAAPKRNQDAILEALASADVDAALKAARRPAIDPLQELDQILQQVDRGTRR